jgi:hypothetical protein
MSDDSMIPDPEDENAILPDPEDDDCDIDGCGCEIAVEDPTSDEDLPLAEGGVA